MLALLVQALPLLGLLAAALMLTEIRDAIHPRPPRFTAPRDREQVRS